MARKRNEVLQKDATVDFSKTTTDTSDNEALKKLEELLKKEESANVKLVEKTIDQDLKNVRMPALKIGQARCYDSALKRYMTDTEVSIKLIVKNNPKRFILV